MSTISSYIGGIGPGVTLGAGFTSPLTVTSTGTVTPLFNTAIYAGPSYANAVVINNGHVYGNQIGVYFKNGGNVANSGTMAGGLPVFIGGLFTGISIKGSAGTVTNAAYIHGGEYAGVALGTGGSVNNTSASALIRGRYFAVAVLAGNGTVSNSGTMKADHNVNGNSVGVSLASGVVNNTGGAAYIYGFADGVRITASAGTVINSGRITAGNMHGVYLPSGGTVRNSGTISGATDAVSFGGTANNRIVLYPGYKLVGKVVGSPSASSTNTLELATGASVGTVSSLTSEFVNFGTAQIDSGANWVLTGTIGAAPRLTVYGTLSGSITNTGTIAGSGQLIASAVVNSGLIEPSVTATGGGSVSNNGGTILATGDGVRLTAGGVVRNIGGLIQGYTNGVRVTGAAGTVTNTGTILGKNGIAVQLALGGAIVNSGAIESALSSYAVVAVYGGAITNNAGGYIGFGGGAYLAGGAILTNAGRVGNLISSLPGVKLGPGGTVIDSGYIGGSSAAIVLYGTGSHQLVLEHGYQLSFNFLNSVQGSGGSNRLTLSGTLGAVTVDFDKSHAGFSNFGTVAFGGAYGNDEILKITNTTALPGTLAGFTQLHEIVDLTQLNPAGASTNFDTLTSRLTVSNTVGQSVTLQLDPNLDYSAVSWVAHPDSGSGTDIVVSSSHTITGSHSGEIILSYPADQSTTITGTISVASGIALYAPGNSGGTYRWTIDNSGTVLGIQLGSSTAGVSGSIVINESGGYIGGFAGVELHGSGTVVNSGTIVNTATSGAGVVLAAGGSVANTGTGLIHGYRGVESDGADGTVTNSATIAGTGFGAGVRLVAGGSVANTGTGLIQGYRGVRIDAAGMVTNSATIVGTGNVGVLFGASGTVVDSGTISGGNGTAISFLGTGNNLLVLEHGYSLGGTVSLAGIANRLELLGSAGAVGVDFNKAFAGFTGFADVTFGLNYGNSETLKITDINALPGTISGFTQLHEIVDLTQLNPVGAHATLNGSNQLVVSNGSQTVSLQLDSENYTGVIWQTGTDGSGGTDVSVACFCRGTLILTDRGERPVEQLAIGDSIVTVSGRLEPIKWIGRRSYDPRFVAGNITVLPVRIAAGALGDGLPWRDLWLSPEHALYIDGTLVAAHLLVNDTSIVQADRVDALEYFHIELGAHDIIIAEGVPAESYVECDNRGMFHNAAEFAALYPADWRASGMFCAPRLEAASPGLARIRAIVARLEAAAA